MSGLEPQARVGFAFCGSFCTMAQVLSALEETAGIYRVQPIVSFPVKSLDTRFGTAEKFLGEMERICNEKVLSTLTEVEPIGPKKLLDVLVIAPCTGNTLAKLSCGIADSPVTLAAKAHLRNGRPVVVAVSTNDGLAGAAKNIGALLAQKNYYFVPFRQDDPVGKPTSLVADMSLIPQAVAAALRGEQLQPVLLGPKKS